MTVRLSAGDSPSCCDNAPTKPAVLAVERGNERRADGMPGKLKQSGKRIVTQMRIHLNCI
jgi:hypothetical protein